MVDSATAAEEPRSDIASYVALLRWPEEAAVLEQLRAAGTPRLLVVAPDASAPLTLECDEDWIRLPASDDDMRMRMSAVAARSSRHVSAPIIKGDGRITFRGRWVALGGTEEAVVHTLAAHFGEVVPGRSLASCVDPPLSGNAVRIQIMRLRARLKPLGLELRTVRSHGYVLEAARAT
jgi:DNA-binding response OmpR family regulator